MRIEQLRDLLHAQPFQRFEMRLADGRVLGVEHPDFLLLGRGGRVILEAANGSLEHINPRLLTGVSVTGDGAESEWSA